jgi:YD repeat-containing protein
MTPGNNANYPGTQIPVNTLTEQSCAVGNPCSVGSGLKTQIETDFVSAGSSPLALKRIYRSSTLVMPMDGFGSVWMHEWQRRLDLSHYNNATPSLSALRGDGTTTAFTLSNGVWTATDGKGDQVASVSDAGGAGQGFRLIDRRTDSTEDYDADGKLLLVKARNGWTTWLKYSTTSTPTAVAPYANLLIEIRSQFGQTIGLAYDAFGRITAATLPDATTVQYSYNNYGMLSTVTYADGSQRKYHYESPEYKFRWALTGITDEKGVRFATYGYDSLGRATSTEHAGGIDRYQLSFLGNGQTSVTTADGTSRIFTTELQGNVLRATGASAPCPACGDIAKAVSYDAAGNVASRKDFADKETLYSYDALGREIQRIEGYGTADAKTTTIEWHPTSNLPLKVAAPGRVEYFSYDTKGQIVGFAWFPTNDSSGSQGTTAEPSGVVTSAGWTYDANGLVTATVGMADDVVTGQWTYTYDDAGKLQTLTNGAGNVGRIVQYDAAGRVLEAINTDGQRIRYQYDARGNPILYEKDGVTVTFEYDAAGFLTATKGPGDYYLGYQYDAAHRVVGMLVPSEKVSPAGTTSRISASASATSDESAAGALEQFWSWLKIWLTSWISEARAQAASVLMPVTGASSHPQPPVQSTRMPADDLEEAAGQRQAPRVGILSIILPDGSSWNSSSSGQAGCDSECAALQAKISELVTDLRLRYLNLTIDKLSLFCVNPIGKFSWIGHLEKYGNKQRELAKVIARAKSKGCSYRSDADYFASLPPPACPVQ